MTFAIIFVAFEAVRTVVLFDATKIAEAIWLPFRRSVRLSAHNQPNRADEAGNWLALFAIFPSKPGLASAKKSGDNAADSQESIL